MVAAVITRFIYTARLSCVLAYSLSRRNCGQGGVCGLTFPVQRLVRAVTLLLFRQHSRQTPVLRQSMSPYSLKLVWILISFTLPYAIRLRGELNPGFWCTTSVTAIADTVVGGRSANLGWWDFLHAAHLKATSSSPFTAKSPVPRWDTCRSATQPVLPSGTSRFRGRTGEPRAELHNRYFYSHRMNSGTCTSHDRRDLRLCHHHTGHTSSMFPDRFPSTPRLRIPNPDEDSRNCGRGGG